MTDIEKVVIWMMERGYATGHGDEVEDLLVELEAQAKERGANEQTTAMTEKEAERTQ